MRIRLFLAAAAALVGLTGCAPLGYEESPVVSKHITELIPSTKRRNVEVVAICYAEEWLNSHWFATTKMEDGGIYHYKLHVPYGQADAEKPVEQVYFTSKAWRAKRYGDGASHRGCFDSDGGYLLRFGRDVSAYIDDDIVVSGRFNDEVKLVLARAVQSIELAATEHKKHVPVETTWGIKP